MSNTAELNLTIQRFVANDSPTPAEPFCLIDSLTIANGPGGSGPQNASGQVGIDPPGQIWVNRKNSAAAPVKLVFNLLPAADSFAPQRIVFAQTAGSDDPDGSANFRDRKPKGSTIAVDDHWSSKGKRRPGLGEKPAPVWKYFIQVKNAAGQSGWIDPGIENAEDMV